MRTNAYSLETLKRAVTEYLNAEEEYRIFLKSWKPGWWENKTAKEREDYTKFDEREQGAWNTVIMMCKMIHIEPDTLIPIIKSVNRWEKHSGKYDRCILSLDDLNWETSESIREAIAVNRERGHYMSTGRKITA